MTVEMIVAMGKNREIGANNELLWKLKADMKNFRKTTLFKTVVMGRNTYDSIGKPLDRRTNIVLTRDLIWDEDGVMIYHNPLEVIRRNRDVMIIGGAEIYKEFLPYARRIYITIVDGEFPEADSFFPVLGDEWKCVSKFKRLKDKDNEYDHWYCVYEK